MFSACIILIDSRPKKSLFLHGQPLCILNPVIQVANGVAPASARTNEAQAAHRLIS